MAAARGAAAKAAPVTRASDARPVKAARAAPRRGDSPMGGGTSLRGLGLPVGSADPHVGTEEGAPDQPRRLPGPTCRVGRLRAGQARGGLDARWRSGMPQRRAGRDQDMTERSAEAFAELSTEA